MKYKTVSLVYLVLFLTCLSAGIYLQDGWVQMFLDYRAPVLILLAFILLLLFSGGTRATALAYFDAFAVDVVDDRIARYRRGLRLIRQGGRLLFLWGAIGVFVGIFILIDNLDETSFIGSSMYFANFCVWIVLICRALFVHPATAALEYKIGNVENKNRSDLINLHYDKIGPWLYLLLLCILPVISIGFFRILGAKVSIFVIPGAALIAPFSALFVCAAGVGFKKMARAFRTAVEKKPHTRGQIDQAVGILRRFGLISIEMGVAGFVIKLIIMLAVIENPEVILGQFILGLVPVFYGLYIAGALCFPLVNRLKLEEV
jgi:flagellar motor component MotA